MLFTATDLFIFSKTCPTQRSKGVTHSGPICFLGSVKYYKTYFTHTVKFEHTPEPLEGLLKLRFQGPNLRVSDSVGWGTV